MEAELEEEEAALTALPRPMESPKCDRMSESPSAVAREALLALEDGWQRAAVPPDGVEAPRAEEEL